MAADKPRPLLQNSLILTLKNTKGSTKNQNIEIISQIFFNVSTSAGIKNLKNKSLIIILEFRQTKYGQTVQQHLNPNCLEFCRLEKEQVVNHLHQKWELRKRFSWSVGKKLV